MKILKTSALAAVLALGSFAANADYSGEADVTLRINTADAISVSFTKPVASFDDVISGDTLTGSVTFTITADSNATTACTITDDADNTESINETDGPTINIMDSSDSSIQLGYVDLTVNGCEDGSNELEFNGLADNEIDPDSTGTHMITLTVDYSGVTSVSAVEQSS